MLRQAASLLPMPAFGVSLSASNIGVQELITLIVQHIMTLQPSGPYVILGCGVFSCVLGTAVACEMQHQLQQQVVLVLLDGPPVLPASVVPDPVVYGLYQQAADRGLLPAASSESIVPVSFAAYAAEASSHLQQALAAKHIHLSLETSSVGLPSLALVSDDEVLALEAAVKQLAAAGLSAVGVNAAGQIQELIWTCRVARSVLAVAPEFVYQGPAVMVLTEDSAGQAFLEAGKECCGGELSLVSLTGLCHGQVLIGDQEQQIVLVAVVDGLMEMLQLM